MHREPLVRRLFAEGLGSSLLAATVVGSGIMAERLAEGNAAVALLANAGATVAVLATLIALLGPLSGAHFNPAVSLVEALRGHLRWRETTAYVGVQVVGCCAGAILAHAMFDLPLIQNSMHVRDGASQLLAEFVATYGLLLVVLGHRRVEDAPWMVAAWIGQPTGHGIHVVRQSGHHHCSVPDQHVLGHSTRRRSMVHRRSAHRSVDRARHGNRVVRQAPRPGPISPLTVPPSGHDLSAVVRGLRQSHGVSRRIDAGPDGSGHLNAIADFRRRTRMP